MHQPSEALLEFTGERVVLGRSDHAVEEYELEHVARYTFARTYARGRFVVDVACGTGYGSALLAAAGARMVHGYDVDPASIEFASREWAGSGVSYAVADACRLPEDDATIDAVVTFETIEHLPDPSVFVEEIARILRPGGVLLLSTPDRDVYNWADHRDDGGNPFHVSEMSRDELVALLEGEFSVKRLLGQVPVPGYAYEGSPQPEPLPSLILPVAQRDRRRARNPHAPARIAGPTKYVFIVARRKRLEAERDDLEAERDGLVAERDDLVAQRDALAVERDEAVTQRDALAVERDEAVTRANAIEGSRTWRYTSWYRATRARLRRR